MKEYLILRLRNAAIAMDRKGDPNMAALLTEAIGELEKHDAAQASVPRYIVIGYGETDNPVCAFIQKPDGLLDAVLGMIYVSPSDAPTDIREAYQKDLADDDEWSGGIWRTEFEIGGIVIYDIGAPLASKAAPIASTEEAQPIVAYMHRWPGCAWELSFADDAGKCIAEHSKAIPLVPADGQCVHEAGKACSNAAHPAAAALEAVDQSIFVQPVPDHCDRIVWRGSYYGLPIAHPAAAQPSREEVLEEWNSLTYLCGLLPADVHWGDDLTLDIARRIVQAAFASQVKP